jgi:hypothetical protein
MFRFKVRGTAGVMKSIDQLPCHAEESMASMSGCGPTSAELLESKGNKIKHTR